MVSQLGGGWWTMIEAGIIAWCVVALVAAFWMDRDKWLR